MRIEFIEPAKDFSDGMHVLNIYHERFLALGKDLIELCDNICKHGMNEERANRSVHMHCFYTHANRLHHLDEEKALFPLIINRSTLIDGMIERLTLDHEEIEQAWARLAQLLGRPEHIEDTGSLTMLAQEFEKLLREHVLRENEDFFPQVEALIEPDQRTQMAETMVKLRHLETW